MPNQRGKLDNDAGYCCVQCGSKFATLQALGGHKSAHSGKRRGHKGNGQESSSLARQNTGASPSPHNFSKRQREETPLEHRDELSHPKNILSSPLFNGQSLPGVHPWELWMRRFHHAGSLQQSLASQGLLPIVPANQVPPLFSVASNNPCSVSGVGSSVTNESFHEAHVSDSHGTARKPLAEPHNNTAHHGYPPFSDIAAQSQKHLQMLTSTSSGYFLESAAKRLRLLESAGDAGKSTSCGRACVLGGQDEASWATKRVESQDLLFPSEQRHGTVRQALERAAEGDLPALDAPRHTQGSVAEAACSGTTSGSESDDSDRVFQDVTLFAPSKATQPLEGEAQLCSQEKPENPEPFADILAKTQSLDFWGQCFNRKRQSCKLIESRNVELDLTLRLCLPG